VLLFSGHGDPLSVDPRDRMFSSAGTWHPFRPGRHHGPAPDPLYV